MDSDKTFFCKFEIKQGVIIVYSKGLKNPLHLFLGISHFTQSTAVFTGSNVFGQVTDAVSWPDVFSSSSQVMHIKGLEFSRTENGGTQKYL